MNNLRLLAGLLGATLLSGGVRAAGTDERVLSLEELFESAEANSAQLRPYFTAEEQARRAEAEARSGRLPDINASLSVSFIGDGFTTERNFSDRQKAPIPHLGNGLALNISQPVYTGGAISRNIEMAKLKSTAARFTTELQRDNIRLRLAGFYLDLYKYGNLRRVVENNIDRAQRILDDMQARKSQGMALRNDITRYELLVSTLRLRLVKIDNMLDILNRELVATAGLPESTKVAPDTTILARALPVAGEGEWRQTALDNAPALKLARNGVNMSRTAEALARSEMLPKIGLQAGWTIDGPILVEVPPINRNLSYWFVGVGITYNISSLYKSNKTVARTRAATLAAEEQLDALRENVELAVRADYISYLEAYEELKSGEKNVELAARNYHTTATRFAEGMALITDMLDAANSRLDAEQQLVNARIDIIYNYYKLLFTSGKI